jgi:hypothetical protein
MTLEKAKAVAIQTILVLALGGGTSTAILQRSWMPWGILSVAITAIIAWWLWQDRHRLSQEYAYREAAPSSVSEPFPGHDRIVWGDKKPSIRDLAIPFFFFSFVALWVAYDASSAPYHRTGRLLSWLIDIIHSELGMPGVVTFWTLSWAWLMTGSLGVVIGCRYHEASRKRNEKV